MEYVLYADVLFIVNFSMDYVTLYLTASLLHLRKKVLNMALSAALGALGGVLSIIYIRNGALSALSGVCLGAAMTYIAFGKAPLRQFIRRGAAVWGSGAFIGGVVTAVASSGRGLRATLPGVIIGGIVAAVAVSRFAAGGVPHTVEITVELCGASVKLTAMTDSGNLLCEPISGRSVILMGAQAARPLLGLAAKDICDLGCSAADSLPPKLREKVRLIPYRAVEGSGMLIGFVPDRVLVGGSECDAVFAVEPGGNYDGFGALVPAALVKRSAAVSKRSKKTDPPEAGSSEAVAVSAGRSTRRV